MQRSRGRRALTTLLACLTTASVVASAGCGSGGGSGAATATAAAPTSPAATSEAAGAPTDAGRFCTLVKHQLDGLSGADLSALVTAGTPEAWKTYFTTRAEQNAALVQASPAQVRPALDTLEAATEALRTELEKAGYDFRKVGMATFAKTVRTPQFATAATTVRTYVKTACGVDLPGA